MRWSAWPTLLLLVLSAGCTDSGGTPEPGGDSPGGEPLAEDAPVTTAPASRPDDRPASPGAGGGSSGPAAASAQALGPSSEPAVGTCDLSAAHAVAADGTILYASQITLACETARLEGPTGRALRSGLLEVEWSQTSPTQPRLDVQAFVDDDEVGRLSGTGTPLRVALEGLDLDPSGEKVLVTWGGDGLFVEFAATVHVSLFETEAVPDGYSAVA